MVRTYDLVIIGGGIHGAGIAQAGAAAGYSVLLLEQTALAHGSSSRSSKLIHGGLRYLETAQFRLVRESLDERRRLLRLAPELVRLIPFHIPIYAATGRRPWQLRIGLGLYALLAGLGSEARFRSLPRARWDALDGLSTDGLQAVFGYQDAQTDDAALTAAVWRSAASLGAELLMPTRFLAAELHAEGARIEYQTAAASESCEARMLINAAGPWASGLLERISPRPATPAMELIRGTHMLLPGRLSVGAFYLEAPQDGRAVFALPRAEATLVGTTECPYHGDPDAVAPNTAECDYLRRVIARYFPHRAADLPLSSFAGLRVLPASRERAFQRSRETLLVPDRASRPRLYSVFGGKLTTYRATAEKLLRRLQPDLPARRPRADTRELPLTPG